MTVKSVLLAPNQQIDFADPRIRYPVLGSLKFDGTRGICMGGDLLTRSMKPQKNQNLPEALKGMIEVAKGRRLVFDFELFDSQASGHGDHTSVLASHEAPIPDSMQCYIFDVMSMDEWGRIQDGKRHTPFRERVEIYHTLKKTHPLLAKDDRYVAVEQVPIEDHRTANLFFEVAVEEGYEGIMLRCPHAPYKHGRATHKEGVIFKFKQFETIDGQIIEVIQRRKLKEGIDRTETPTGHMERVHTKGSYELDEMVGAFKVLFEDGTISEVNYGRGFDHETRRQHWRDRESLIGRHVEVRHLPHGAKEGVRIGTLQRFRDDKA